MARKTFIAAIALGSFFANPAWGHEGLPRNVAGSVISDRWIQPGESFWLNPDHWVHTYQNYCTPIDHGPTIEVDFPDPPSVEEQKPEAAPTDPAPPAQPDQAEGKEQPPEQPPAPAAEEPKPAASPKKKSAPKPKAAAAPAAVAEEPKPAEEAPTASADAPQE